MIDRTPDQLPSLSSGITFLETDEQTTTAFHALTIILSILLDHEKRPHHHEKDRQD